ncbi:DUF433 domain-containing protein [Leifsonia virtsii]|uniref:DUF433 domain-containing protein n=1 Tax=Leifsonia virtsii TaxID=3035915 RepID=A0ABT8ISW6_9MICO|nr:DUF433 domain-containing protein [Leifsonia virtsii]MDN4595895.1 DUF433 domain-containing protein [Leifsonia virtsii]
MAFPVPLTSKLSGATRAQLQHWRRTDILVPEVRSTGRPLLYSFRDIAALRAFAKLRHEASLQQIRKALNSLHAMDMFEHPSAYKLAREGDSIVLQRGDGEPVDLVRHPGQLLIANFEDILGEFENVAGERVVDLRRPGRHLQVEPDRLGGWPTIEGTRIPFDTIADLMSGGSMSPAQVAYYYPEVTPEAAVSALEFADSLREPAAA